MAHGALADVVVHAVPSDMSEDDLKITATLAAGATLTEEELFRWAIDELPYFALPRYIEFRADLPRSPVGRVLKRELREQGVTDATWTPRPPASPTTSGDGVSAAPRRSACWSAPGCWAPRRRVHPWGRSGGGRDQHRGAKGVFRGTILPRRHRRPAGSGLRAGGAG